MATTAAAAATSPSSHPSSLPARPSAPTPPTPMLPSHPYVPPTTPTSRKYSHSSSSTHAKSVQFSKFVKVSYTFPQSEYDRLPIDVAEMTSTDFYEFYQMQFQMYQRMKEEITLRQIGMGGGVGLAWREDGPVVEGLAGPASS